MPKINPTLLKLAQNKVWDQAGKEKQSFQPPGGGDPAAAGGAMPPGGAPPGMPPGGMPTMDPAAAGAAGMPPMGDPMAAGMMPAAPQPQGQGAGGKPKFDPLMLDYRMYNLQQQLSAIMNALNIEVPPQALIMPPGTMGAPPAEQAMPGGPMDPSQQGGGGGGGSAISPIEPMQAASPELAAVGGGGGGGPKMASATWDPRQVHQSLPDDVSEFQKEAEANAPTGWRVLMVKASDAMESENVDNQPGPKKSSTPHKELNVPGAPGKRPATQNITAGGSKDPESRPETDADMGPVNGKAASFGIAANIPGYDDYNELNVGMPVEQDIATPRRRSPVEGAAAVAAMFRSQSHYGGK